MTENINFVPSEIDNKHLQEIRDFLNDEGIPFVESNDLCGLFTIKDIKGQTIELRYVDSYFYPIDNSKRFGDIGKGVDINYFINISHQNYDNGIRTIWIFDFEMEETNVGLIDGVVTPNYRRQWEVIKNTIRTATGHIRKRFYARDCYIKLVGNDELRPFLDTNCFYGYRSANKNIGLYLKKDKNGLKKDTLLFVYTFGYNFYGNKKRMDDPFIEIIRSSTKIGCQVIGGMSKCLKYFCETYPTLQIGDNEIKVNELIFYVDASHNDARGMQNKDLGFNFVSWNGAGFMNRWTDDVEDIETDSEGKKKILKGKKGEIFHRKPMYHKQIMKLMSQGKIVSIANAGTIVYSIMREDFLNKKK